jgi:hypothetical protein
MSAAAVTVSPAPGTYQTPQVVTLTAVGGASGTIYWTQDGSVPNPLIEKGYVGTSTVYVNDGQTLNVAVLTTGVLSGPTSYSYVIVRQGRNVPAYGPSKRLTDIRSLSFGLSGQIQPYPVYQFSGYRTKWERDRHNPFSSVPPYV